MNIPEQNGWREEFNRLFIEENYWQGDDEFTKNVAVGNILDFIERTLQAQREEMVRRIEGLKLCENFERASTHSCIEGCDGIIENCRNCHRDRCSNKECPLGKGRADTNKSFNQGINAALALIKDTKPL